jgi:DNA-directed RNA polymerase subunit RPC12/RpoP
VTTGMRAVTKTNPCVINTMGMDDDEIKRRIRLGDWGQCSYCKCIFDWGEIPNENVRAITVDDDVVGQEIRCPECGYVSFY